MLKWMIRMKCPNASPFRLCRVSWRFCQKWSDCAEEKEAEVPRDLCHKRSHVESLELTIPAASAELSLLSLLAFFHPLLFPTLLHPLYVSIQCPPILRLPVTQRWWVFIIKSARKSEKVLLG